MKRFFAIMAIVLIVVAPVFAGGVKETIGGIVGGGGAGAGIGAAIGSIIPGIGTAVGAIIGGVIGATAGGLHGAAQDQQNAAQEELYEAQEEQIELQTEQNYQDNYITAKQNYDSMYTSYNNAQTNIKQGIANIDSYDQAILRWQDQYDIGLTQIQNQGKVDYRTVMNNYASAANAAAVTGQSGGTADIIARSQRDEVVSLVGDDLRLDAIGGTYGSTVKEYTLDELTAFDELVAQRSIEEEAIATNVEAAKKYGKELSESEKILKNASDDYFTGTSGYDYTKTLTDREKETLDSIRKGTASVPGYTKNSKVEEEILRKRKLLEGLK